MTKTSMTLLALACALAVSACKPPEEGGTSGHAGHETALKPSSAGLPSGDLVAGKELASKKGATGQSCVDCHGAEGNAPIDASYPKLGGQYQDYLAHAIQGYRNGQREHSLMSGQAIALTDQQIADLAAYFGNAPSQLRDLHNAE